MSFNRKLIKSEQPKSEQIKSEQTKTISEQATADKSEHINKWGKDVRQMDAGTLDAYIHAYEQDTWKDSPEFKELEKRLRTLSLKQLRDGGYYIPSQRSAAESN